VYDGETVIVNCVFRSLERRQLPFWLVFLLPFLYRTPLVRRTFQFIILLSDYGLNTRLQAVSQLLMRVKYSGIHVYYIAYCNYVLCKFYFFYPSLP